MASRSGVIAAQRLIVTFWNLPKVQEDRLTSALPAWQTHLVDIPDDALLATIKAWPDRNKPPTLAQLVAPPPSPKSTSAADGCSGCRTSGLRQVLRWHATLGLQELTTRCACQAGDRRKSQGIALHNDVRDAWARDPSTIDGPHVDPEPQHRVHPDRRAAFAARAAARLAEVQANVPAAAPTTPLW